MATAEILEKYRERFTIRDAKEMCRGPRSAYSMVNMYCGACIDVLCGVRSLFKPLFATDIDKVCRKIYFDLTGSVCYKTAEDVPDSIGNIVLMVFTPPCPDYSTGNPNPQGRHGSNNGAEFVKILQNCACTNVHKRAQMYTNMQTCAQLSQVYCSSTASLLCRAMSHNGRRRRAGL